MLKCLECKKKVSDEFADEPCPHCDSFEGYSVVGEPDDFRESEIAENSALFERSYSNRKFLH